MENNKQNRKPYIELVDSARARKNNNCDRVMFDSGLASYMTPSVDSVSSGKACNKNFVPADAIINDAKGEGGLSVNLISENRTCAVQLPGTLIFSSLNMDLLSDAVRLSRDDNFSSLFCRAFRFQFLFN